nr:hypothetical protein CFP56_69365 [Quercus suber]
MILPTVTVSEPAGLGKYVAPRHEEGGTKTVVRAGVAVDKESLVCDCGAVAVMVEASAGIKSVKDTSKSEVTSAGVRALEGNDILLPRTAMLAGRCTVWKIDRRCRTGGGSEI